MLLRLSISRNDHTYTGLDTTVCLRQLEREINCSLLLFFVAPNLV